MKNEERRVKNEEFATAIEKLIIQEDERIDFEL